MPAKRVPAASLPAVLARPPWRERAIELPVVEGLTPLPLPLPPRLELTESLRAQYAEPVMRLADLRGFNQVPNDVEPGTPEMDAFVLRRLGQPTREGASYLSLASDAAAIAYLERTGLGNLMAGSADIAHLLVRFGPEVEPILRRDPSGAAVLGRLTPSSDTAARNVELALRGPYHQRGIGEAYLARYPEAAAIVLLPMALSPATQKEALPLLQKLTAADRQAYEEVAGRYGPAVAEALPKLLAYRPERPVPPLPKYAISAKLPPIALAAGGDVPKAAAREVLTLLRLLRENEWREARGWLTELERAAAPGSLAAFAWALYEAWYAAGSPYEGQFVPDALGVLGDDAAVHALAARLLPWAREHAYNAVDDALGIFLAIGSDAAIGAIAEAAEVGGPIGDDVVAERAARQLDEAARRRKMPVEDLVDAVVPRALDDAALAARQESRLDAALAAGRRWTGARFRAHVLAHPLLARLARGLVWATFSGAEMGARFRVSAEGALVDAGDCALAIAIADDAELGLAHPIDLDAAEIAAWRAAFAREGLVQPLPQLDRQRYRMTEEERRGPTFSRWSGREVPEEALRALAFRGWKVIEHEDGGILCLRRTFLGGLEAEVEMDRRKVRSRARPARYEHWILGVKVERARSRVCPADLPPAAFSELASAIEAFAPPAS
jgi:hypothetical protein